MPGVTIVTISAFVAWYNGDINRGDTANIEKRKTEMKTMTPRNCALAAATALTLLSAQAGYCINPQPLPPRHIPTLLHFLATLLHLPGGHF